MGYQIEYHLQEIRHTRLKKKLPVYWKAVLLALCVIAGHFSFVFLQVMLGGQWQETVAASEQMAEALKQGLSIQEAVQVFYTELIS